MTREQAEQFRLDRDNWVLGVIYICKEDPRAIVRNLWIFGWTWNFGRSIVILLVPLTVFIFLAPVFVIAPMFSINAVELAILYLIIFTVLIVLSSYIAQGPR